MTVGAGATRPVLQRQLAEDEIPAFCETRIQLCGALEGDDKIAADDVRTLEVRYSASGERQRSFKETVAELRVTEFEDFPVTPRTLLEYIRAISSIAESATAHHHMWIGHILQACRSLGAPPKTACGSGALKALRVASSTYMMSEVGVGDTVPLRLSQLSLPQGGSAGVDLVESLEGPLREHVQNFEDTLLQDADVWTHISRNSEFLQPYNDPSLQSDKKYIELLQLLYQRGFLSFTEDNRCRVGLSAVSKKAKDASRDF